MELQQGMGRPRPQRVNKSGSRAAAFTRGSHAGTILVVDDEPIIRELLRQVLEGEFEVLAAPDGPTALGLLRSHRVDLILLDVLLPGMSGVEVLERVRAIRPKTPAILISGGATVPTAVTAMKLGAVDCLIKPFSNAELLARVRGVLAGRSSAPTVHQSNRPLLLVGTDLGVIATLYVAINTRLPVSSAWTLPEASEKTASQSYGAIVLDDSLTPVHSLDFLRAARPRLASSSIIVLSSHPEQWRSGEFAAVAINTIMSKPFQLSVLMDHLAAACIVEQALPAKARFN
jgi:DNA-binding response OmpR family regulator